LPGHKTNGDLRSPLISLECIDWEQALNVELLRRMQAIHEKLEKRRAEYQRQSGSNPFLPALTAAMGAWLGELEAAAVASEEDITRFGAKPKFRVMAKDAIPPDGKMLCAALVENIRKYEAEWRTAFDEGKDPDATPVPCVTKEMLACIIRQCPVVDGRLTQRYSSEWLLENVGSRFFLQKPKEPSLHLVHTGLTQADLNCTDQVWSSIQPIAKPIRPFCSPRYFAPVPGLMRARHALHLLKPTTESKSLTKDRDMLVREDI
jgi:hypothetical protein